MLYEPKVPGDKDGKMFVGWFEDGSTSVFTGFGTVGTIKTDGEVVSLHATYANVSYVRNHDESGAVIESTKATEGSTVTVESDSLLIKCNQVAECQVDWKTAEGTAVVEKTGFSTIDPVEASMTVSGNVDLYPNVREGYWVSFDSKDGTPFSKQFIALDSADKTAKNPGTPILEGYTFAGWYTEDGTLVEDPSAVNVEESLILVAKYTEGAAEKPDSSIDGGQSADGTTAENTDTTANTANDSAAAVSEKKSSPSTGIENGAGLILLTGACAAAAILAVRRKHA